MHSTSLGEGLLLHSMIEMKVRGAYGDHPRFEDNMKLLTSFFSELDRIVGPGL